MAQPFWELIAVSSSLSPGQTLRLYDGVLCVHPAGLQYAAWSREEIAGLSVSVFLSQLFLPLFTLEGAHSETDKHRDTYRHTHRDGGTQTHRWKQRHRYTQTHRDRHTRKHRYNDT